MKCYTRSSLKSTIAISTVYRKSAYQIETEQNIL